MRLICFWLLLILSVPAAASDVPEREAWRVETIEIKGLNRTEPRVVKREILFREGAIVTRAQLVESMQRLRNMGLFRTAEYTLVPTDPSGVAVRVIIEVDERWTILPFLNISFGGDLFSLVAGVYDINILGKFLDAGVRYQRLGDTNSYAAWFYDPRFLDKRLFFGGQFSWANRLRYLIDEDGEVEGGYLRQRRLLNLVAQKEVTNTFSYGGGVTLQHDHFSFDLVDDETVALQQPMGLPEDQQHGMLIANITLGRINEDSYLREGIELTQSVAVAHPLWGSSESYVESGTQLLAFARFRWKQNVGLRAGLGLTSAKHIENQFFLGGLDTVRGFYDSRFRGPYYWYTNAEYRIPSLDYRWFVLQHVAFVDAVGVSERGATLWNADGVSAGIGVRLLSPKIYGSGARIDYAIPLKGHGTTPISFGVLQFF